MDAASPPRTDRAAHGRSGAPPAGLPHDPFGTARRVPAQDVPAIDVEDAPPPPPAPSREGFAPAVASKLRSYVYLLVDPRTGRPFFVGKGRGDRCFEHVAAARSGHAPGEGDRDAEAYPVLDRIREAESDGREVRIDILRHGLSPREAVLVEGAVADALGIEARTKRSTRRRAAGEMDVALAKRAKFKRSHQVVLLRVGGAGADATYESARHGWRIGRRWIDPNAPRSPRWAAVVVADLVAAVFRIDHWERTGGATDRGEARYSFVGVRDEELERRYLGRSVAALRGAGRESPVTYVWCGPHWVNTAG